MKYNLLVAMLFSSVLALAIPIGCGPSRKPSAKTLLDSYFYQNGENVPILQFNVLFPASLGAKLQSSPDNEDKKIWLYEAVRAHVLAFERNEGVISRYGGIALTDSANIQICDPNHKGTIIGCTSGNKIVCFRGENYTVPALYHELAHMNLALFDPEHQDPRWKIWDARGQEVVAELLSRRGVK